MAAARRLASTMAATKAHHRMQDWFPGTAYPLIVSAPMAGIANPRLAAEVTKAGGLGFFQHGPDFTPNCAALDKLDTSLAELATAAGAAGADTGHDPAVTSGVGFLAFGATLATHFAETAIPVLARHPPAAVWFFAPEPTAPEGLRDALAAVKELQRQQKSTSKSKTPRIVVQVGTVAAARQAVRYGADIVVAQGVDAGGHQWQRGSGVVSLVPEVVDMVAEETAAGASRAGDEVAVWAAGGIADGRGVAAAMALGAEGVVMGTRYMVATESDALQYKKKAVIETTDGGASTVKSYHHDHVQGFMFWPELYDGRAIVHPSYTEHAAGATLEETRDRFKAAAAEGDISRGITWSGTGVGLVREELPAGEITKRTREQALKILANLRV